MYAECHYADSHFAECHGVRDNEMKNGSLVLGFNTVAKKFHNTQHNGVQQNDTQHGLNSYIQDKHHYALRLVYIGDICWR